MIMSEWQYEGGPLHGRTVTEPATIARLDQYSAAVDEARQAADARNLLPCCGEVTGRLVRGLRLRLARDQVRPCAHLGRGPKPAVWYPWQPHALHCFGCADSATELLGPVEARTCDGCRQLSCGWVLRYGVVPGRPIIVQAALCERCGNQDAPPVA